MKIAKLVLRNFRAYSEVNVDFDENFNVIIGKNDIGKSTILEALEIFFNNETVKIDINDCHVHATEKSMSIQVSFSPEDKLYTIDTIPTDLRKEFLLDKNELLSIKKTWDCSKDKITAASLKTHIVANYPVDFATPLIVEKITELKKHLNNYTDKLNIAEVKKNTSSEIRQAIYSVSEFTDFTEIDIPIDNTEGKKIWDSLKHDLPLFFLFQSDRENKDSDKEVQDPLKAITRSAISELEDKLEAVKLEIKTKAEEIGRQTLAKLKEMNPEIADVLSPEMTNRPWESLFSFSFNCDDGIPINKRGSGVRRLILLNYFRAEAERQNADAKNVIYAIEEPETSQHPNWQVELFNALIKLSENSNTQIITTTHSPALASLVEPKNIIFIYKADNEIKVATGEESNLEEIAETLGVLPNIPVSINDAGVKVILCLEGPTDVEFFNHIGKNLFNLDIANHPAIMSVSLGGGTLIHWVNKNYLRKLNKPEIHIYDNDVNKYHAAVNEVNSRDNSWACTTKMLELENYIHPSIISDLYQTQDSFFEMPPNSLDDWKVKDVPKNLSIFLKEQKASNNPQITGEGADSIKRTFSEKGAPLMTIELLHELGVYDEVEDWFNRIKGYLSTT